MEEIIKVNDKEYIISYEGELADFKKESLIEQIKKLHNITKLSPTATCTRKTAKTNDVVNMSSTVTGTPTLSIRFWKGSAQIGTTCTSATSPKTCTETYTVLSGDYGYTQFKVSVTDNCNNSITESCYVNLNMNLIKFVLDGSNKKAAITKQTHATSPVTYTYRTFAIVNVTELKSGQNKARIQMSTDLGGTERYIQVCNDLKGLYQGIYLENAGLSGNYTSSSSVKLYPHEVYADCDPSIYTWGNETDEKTSVTISTYSSTAPGKPTLTLTPEDTAISADWTSVTSFAYYVKVAHDSTIDFEGYTLLTSLRFTGLTNGTTYTISVQPYSESYIPSGITIGTNQKDASPTACSAMSCTFSVS